MSEPLSVEQRREILEAEIAAATRAGWAVTTRTDTSATMIKKKKFSWVWAIIWFLLLFIGLLIYLIYYLTKKDQHLFVQVEPDGQVTRTHS